MRQIVESIEGEFRRYKTLAEGAMEQVADEQLSQRAGADGNSIAALVWHVAGNFESRFTDFLGSDGEKPWRDRENEFVFVRPTDNLHSDRQAVIGVIHRHDGRGIAE
jgi:hypothetical protein